MKDRLDRFALVAVPLVLLAIVLFVSHHRSREERDLASFLLENAGEGDIVILVSTDLAKIDRLPGLAVLYTDAVHWNDVVGYRTAWIVGPPHLEVPVLGEARVRDIGPYRVHELDLSDHDAGWKGYPLMERLAEANVQRLGAKVEPCPLSAGVFTCPGEEWLSVSVRRVSMGAAPFECIWAHPKDDSRLVILFPRTPGGTTLFLEGGIDDDGVYYPEGTPVIVDVESGGRALGRARFENIPGLQARTVALETPIGDPAPLVLEITSDSQDTRHFCFRGWLGDIRGANGD